MSRCSLNGKSTSWQYVKYRTMSTLESKSQCNQHHACHVIFLFVLFCPSADMQKANDSNLLPALPPPYSPKNIFLRRCSILGDSAGARWKTTKCKENFTCTLTVSQGPALPSGTCVITYDHGSTFHAQQKLQIKQTPWNMMKQFLHIAVSFNQTTNLWSCAT